MTAELKRQRRRARNLKNLFNGGFPPFRKIKACLEGVMSMTPEERRRPPLSYNEKELRFLGLEFVSYNDLCKKEKA